MKTFFFYDLETSGFNARDQRIMQFAGQRTDMDLKQLGDPINVLVRLSDDILPNPGSVLVTGITPQNTQSEGLSEPELCKLLSSDVFTPDTVVVGFNNIRFDDEFIRHLFWRNFYDPYEWAWSEGRGRWDILDVARMTRALRPDGIAWPVDDTGKPVNSLVPLASSNNLLHSRAHDALSDVEALIGLAQLLKQKQPGVFDHLFKVRDKKKVAEFVNLDSPKPFVYTSGRYSTEHEKTTVAIPIGPGPKPNSILVYDLLHDPDLLRGATPKALAEGMFARRERRQEPDFVPVSIKEIVLNKCPAVAPVGVLDKKTQERLKISLDLVQENLKKLSTQTDLGDRAREAFEMREPYEASTDPESQLYDGFVNDKDKGRMAVVRAASGAELADFHPEFADERLTELLLRYKARWYPASLDEGEQIQWEEYRARKISAALPGYLKQLATLSKKGDDTFLFEELQLWAESIFPAEL